MKQKPLKPMDGSKIMEDHSSNDSDRLMNDKKTSPQTPEGSTRPCCMSYRAAPPSPASGPARGFARRKLLHILLGTSLGSWAASVIYPTLRFLFPPEGPPILERSVNVGKVADIPPDSGQLFRIGNKPGLLVRTASGQFRAYIAICTHLDCTVQFKADESIIWCACHNGRYNLQGANIAGPPPRPLDPLVVTIKAEEVHVSLPG